MSQSFRTPRTNVWTRMAIPTCVMAVVIVSSSHLMADNWKNCAQGQDCCRQWVQDWTKRTHPPNCQCCPSNQAGPGAAPTDPSDPNSATNDPNAANDMAPNPLFPDPGQINPAQSSFNSNFQAASSSRTIAPNMIGDFFGTSNNEFTFAIDRLGVVTSEIDVPTDVATSVLSGSNMNPVQIFNADSGVANIQQIQSAFRADADFLWNPLPFVGSVSAPGTLTSTATASDANSILASSRRQGFDIVPVVEPPSSYASAVESIFRSRNNVSSSPIGNSSESGEDHHSSQLEPFVVYDSAGSGAIVQDGVDALNSPSSELVPYYYYDYLVTMNLPSPSGGAVVGRQKIAENTSPIPRDRVFFNYSYFNNVPLFAGGTNVNRFTPGFERTFLNGSSSFEMRFPFASTLDSSIVTDGLTNDSSVQFGNINMALKTLLYTNETFALSAGMALTAPTAYDLNVRLADGTNLVRVTNSSVHLLPFVGGLYQPSSRFFTQGFIQFDFDTNGNPVYINSMDGNGLQGVGTANDVSFMYIDMGAGYRAYENTVTNEGLTAITPMLELHWNGSLGDTDVVRSGAFQVGSFADDVQILNAVLGSNFEFNREINLTVAYALPIGNSSDQQFDGEVRVMFNWIPGGGGIGPSLMNSLR